MAINNGVESIILLNDRINKVEEVTNDTKDRLSVHIESTKGLKDNLKSIENKVDMVVVKLDDAAKKLLVIDVNKDNNEKSKAFWIQLLGAIAASGILGSFLELAMHHWVLK
jgi:hypothetical protein